MGETRTGKIVRIHEAGICFIQDVATNEPYVFTFDKIPNYQGQTAEELGLALDGLIEFTLTGEQATPIIRPAVPARSVATA